MGSFLDFVDSSAVMPHVMPHGAQRQMSNRKRIDRHPVYWTALCRRAHRTRHRLTVRYAQHHRVLGSLPCNQVDRRLLDGLPYNQVGSERSLGAQPALVRSVRQFPRDTCFAGACVCVYGHGAAAREEGGVFGHCTWLVVMSLACSATAL